MTQGEVIGPVAAGPSGTALGMNKLCRHNFGNNRQPKAFENYAGIMADFLCMCMTYALDAYLEHAMRHEEKE